MKKVLSFLFVCAMIASCGSREGKWELVWEENFDGTQLDTTVWSRTYRGTADWQNTQSLREDLLEVHDGMLVLWGIVNPNPVSPEALVDGQITIENDTAQYLTAGVASMNKHAFPAEGRIEVRARLQGARGAWPAIWLMPFERVDEWPHGGEIDMMERLNFDSIAYQTIHTHYTYDLKKDSIPPHYATIPINVDDFNIYAVEFHKDSVVLSTNGQRSFAYPRLDDKEAEAEGQFPFIRPWFMLIDMQLGGKWVGEVDPKDLPIKMEIDWVRHYIKK